MYKQNVCGGERNGEQKKKKKNYTKDNDNYMTAGQSSHVRGLTAHVYRVVAFVVCDAAAAAVKPSS